MSATPGKRLIVCCDGTWMDSDDGFKRPTLIPYVPTGTLQVPSNVTRISRALKRIGLDGTPQIIYYQSGVGTESSMIDTISGGLLGTGISENIREAYSFVAANYVPGDEIILIGFSRGAFTVRSVAGMIRDIGLLTREGMADFYPIFKDQENFRNPNYRDIFPTIPFPDKPTGDDPAHEYKRRLEKDGLTRIYDASGNKIRVQAVAVWDTVGSLGIPTISFLAKLGLPHSSKEYKFYDTNLSGNIRHAFQCLALDEHRHPFQAAVWERTNMQKTTVDLRQVWIPGAHSNVGGGYDDQEIANIALAWMMDQLASIGVAFQDEYIEAIFNQSVEYYENPPKTPASLSSLVSRRPTKQWAVDSVYEKHKPVRPWGLGKIYNSESGMYLITGTGWRSPGLNTRANPDTGGINDPLVKTNIPMTHTNERIHSCVRVRLELEGLGLDDLGRYKCHALLHKGWHLRQMRLKVEDPIPWNASWGPGAPAPDTQPDDLRWVWEWDGPEDQAPLERIMVEDNLGPYERKLLLLNRGANYHKGYKRRRKRKTKGEIDVEKDKFMPGDDRRRSMNSAAAGAAGIVVARTGSRARAEVRDLDSEKPRRRRRRERGSDEDSLIDKKGPFIVSDPDKHRRRRGDSGRERKSRHNGEEIVVIADRTKVRETSRAPPRPPPVDPRGSERQYREEVKIRASSRAPPPPTTRSTPRPPSTDPSQRKYTMEDIIFTQEPGRSIVTSRPPTAPPPVYEARRSGSGPQYPVEEDEIVVIEEHTVPRRKNRGYERREYPIVEDITPVEDHRARERSRARPPPPPPSGFSSIPGEGEEKRERARGYRRNHSESGSGVGSASDSGFDEKDGNLKGRRDRDREIHRLYRRPEVGSDRGD